MNCEQCNTELNDYNERENGYCDVCWLIVVNEALRHQHNSKVLAHRANASLTANQKRVLKLMKDNPHYQIEYRIDLRSGKHTSHIYHAVREADERAYHVTVRRIDTRITHPAIDPLLYCHQVGTYGKSTVFIYGYYEKGATND